MFDFPAKLKRVSMAKIQRYGNKASRSSSLPQSVCNATFQPIREQLPHALQQKPRQREENSVYSACASSCSNFAHSCILSKYGDKFIAAMRFAL